MLDQLVKLVEQNAGSAIVQNTAIPNQFNQAAIQEVASQIFDGLKGQAAAGNPQQLMSLFGKGTSASSLANNPIVTKIISTVAANFASKFGVSPQVAQGIVSGLVPTVMNQLVAKTMDPKDSSFDLQDMIQGFAGNKNVDVSGLLGKLTGGNKNENEGGLGGMLGGMFK